VRSVIGEKATAPTKRVPRVENKEARREEPIEASERVIHRGMVVSDLQGCFRVILVAQIDTRLQTVAL